MNESFESSANTLTTATYSAAAVYFGLVAIIAVVVNLSIIAVYLKNKKVSFLFFECCFHGQSCSLPLFLRTAQLIFDSCGIIGSFATVVTP